MHSERFRLVEEICMALLNLLFIFAIARMAPVIGQEEPI